MLDGADALVERLRRVRRLDRDLLLQDHRSAVDALVEEVDGDARRGSARRKRLTDRVHAWEGGEEGRVDVDRAKTCQEGRRQKVHVAGTDHDLSALVG